MKNCRTWHWQNFQSWNETAWKLMKDVLTLEVVAEFKREPPEYIVGDDLTWLDDIVKCMTGDVIVTGDVFANRLSQHYHALRAYHGTRLLDKDSFYKNGIYPLQPEEFEKKAFKLFSEASFPELTVDAVQVAIEKVGRQYREGRVYFEANEEHLVEFCAHYMLYGSEYLCAIAANIPGQRDYRQELKKFGTPTIFECDIPLAIIDRDLLKEFAGGALAVMFSTMIDPSFNHSEKWDGAGLYISQPLLPEYIVGHRTPAVLKDPLLGGRVTKTESSAS
jgi:hypothetical protein